MSFDCLPARRNFPSAGKMASHRHSGAQQGAVRCLVGSMTTKFRALRWKPIAAHFPHAVHVLANFMRFFGDDERFPWVHSFKRRVCVPPQALSIPTPRQRPGRSRNPPLKCRPSVGPPPVAEITPAGRSRHSQREGVCPTEFLLPRPASLPGLSSPTPKFRLAHALPRKSFIWTCSATQRFDHREGRVDLARAKSLVP